MRRDKAPGLGLVTVTIDGKEMEGGIEDVRAMVDVAGLVLAAMERSPDTLQARRPLLRAALASVACLRANVAELCPGPPTKETP